MLAEGFRHSDRDRALTGGRGIAGDAVAGRTGSEQEAGLAGCRREHVGDLFGVAGLTTISPALAAPSISTTPVAAGPVSTNSRCESPTRQISTGPLWTPIEVRSVTDPADVCDPAERRAGPDACALRCGSRAGRGRNR